MMKKSAKIYYFSLTDEMLREDKLQWFASTEFKDIDFERIIPDKNHNWLNIADNDFDDLLPLVNKETKLAKTQENERAVFKLFSLGVVTARDEWVYDYSIEHLENKVKYLIDIYNQDVKKHSSATKSSVSDVVDYAIKWTRAVKNDLLKNRFYEFDNSLIVKSFYRPFVQKNLYFSRNLNEMQYQIPNIFPLYQKQENKLITTMGDSTGKPFFVLSINSLPDLNFVSPASGGTRCLPLYRYDSKGNRIENITDWGLKQFQNHYQNQSITKLDIFHYTYAVLHNPAYREKYALNLKREFPRLPFYDNFNQWVLWGKQLMDLHLNYEQADKYPLKQIDIETSKENKPKLKADKQAGKIYLDSVSTLQGVPSAAWDYKLGNRSALEWILDQYKEKKPRDKTIAEKFNTYRFSDYKVQVIDLLQRVCTVSVETMKIIEEMDIQN